MHVSQAHVQQESVTTSGVPSPSDDQLDSSPGDNGLVMPSALDVGGESGGGVHFGLGKVQKEEPAAMKGGCVHVHVLISLQCYDTARLTCAYTCTSIASYPGFPGPDFILQMWRKIPEFSPRL